MALRQTGALDVCGCSSTNNCLYLSVPKVTHHRNRTQSMDAVNHAGKADDFRKVILEVIHWLRKQW